MTEATTPAGEAPNAQPAGSKPATDAAHAPVEDTFDLMQEEEERARVMWGLIHGLVVSFALVGMVWVLHLVFGSHVG